MPGPTHYHPEYRTQAEAHRLEDRLDKRFSDTAQEISALREEVRELGNKVVLMLGGLGLVAFLLPIVAPFLRQLLNIP